MSHRKYAEMYNFYKFYLLRNQKYTVNKKQLNLMPYPGTTIFTHVRLFMNFLQNDEKMQ